MLSWTGRPAALAAIDAALNPVPKAPKADATPAKPKRSRAGLLSCAVCKSKMGHADGCAERARIIAALLETRVQWDALKVLGVNIMRYDSPDTVAQAVARRMVPQAAADAALEGRAEDARRIVATWRALALEGVGSDSAAPQESRISAPVAVAAVAVSPSEGSDRTHSASSAHAADRARFRSRRQHNGRLRRRVTA